MRACREGRTLMVDEADKARPRSESMRDPCPRHGPGHGPSPVPSRWRRDPSLYPSHGSWSEVDEQMKLIRVSIATKCEAKPSESSELDSKDCGARDRRGDEVGVSSHYPSHYPSHCRIRYASQKSNLSVYTWIIALDKSESGFRVSARSFAGPALCCPELSRQAGRATDTRRRPARMLAGR